MRPPYEISDATLQMLVDIASIAGQINATHLVRSDPMLRRENRIRTIHASLEIEGNTLSLDQVTQILDDKHVLGPEQDIREVRNAIAVYDALPEFDCNSEADFLRAHHMLMNGLVDRPGSYRTGSIGIVAGSEVRHVAPPADIIPGLMHGLFGYIASDPAPALVKSCVAHYEIEFIHPFADGNGRMGRLWQTCMLSKAMPVFLYLPIEPAVRDHQDEYYAVLSQCDKQGSSTAFIEFMLRLILDQLQLLAATPRRVSPTPETRLTLAREHFTTWFTRRDYLVLFKEISAPTASRDLRQGLEHGLLHKRGKGNQTEYSF